MTLVQHQGKLQITCDSCPLTYRRTYVEEDFAIMRADITAEGWRTRRKADKWTHTCPDCARSNERRLF